MNMNSCQESVYRASFQNTGFVMEVFVIDRHLNDGSPK